ncbi:MAG TPA: ABC transporter substrate-binding protein [Chloroflexota bacterium]|nr:ABC transporter substrate-binding protein [Chloroflexota bacterium]
MQRWALLITLLVGLAGCAAPAPARAPGQAGPAQPAAEPSAAVPRTALQLALNTVSASMAPLWVAKDTGIFDQYGFDVEFVTLQSSSQVAKVMASGEMPVAISAAAGVVDAVLAGDDQVLISGFQNYMNFWVYARPEIASVAELRGKKIGTSRIGSGAHLGVVEMLRRAGLEPDRDAAVLQLGGMNEILGALTAGAVDAAILSIPFNIHAQDAGLRLIYDVSAQRIPYLQNGLATTRRYLQQHEELLRRLMMAHVEGLARVHKDKATTVESLARYLKSEDYELMERTYDLIEPLFERVPYPTAASIQTVIDQRAMENPAARNITPAQVSDERLLRELEATGFINRVYGS